MGLRVCGFEPSFGEGQCKKLELSFTLYMRRIQVITSLVNLTYEVAELLIDLFVIMRELLNTFQGPSERRYRPPLIFAFFCREAWCCLEW